MTPSLFLNSGATFSDCGKYRYSLWRKWSEGPVLNMLMLNPSKAGEVESDPTVTRQITRAQMLGMGSLVVTNIFAWVDTAPSAMKRAADPVGQFNDHHLVDAARAAISSGGMVIAAWGTHGKHLLRSHRVAQLMKNFDIPLHALKVTTGEPWHPLYLPYELQPFRWPKETL